MAHSINTYLSFNGNCEEAFNFYKSIIGGEFVFLGRFKDMPPEIPVEEADKEKIMHVSLPIGPSSMLQGSDTGPNMGGTVQQGNNFSISILAETKAEADRLFSELSEGGETIYPMNETFWGSYFGHLKDKFGIRWMINFDLQTNPNQ